MAIAAPSLAVVIHPDTSQGTPDPEQPPPPADDPGWDRFGAYAPGGAIYLGLNAAGEPWMLTARHLGMESDFVLDGEIYATDGFVAFTNPDSSLADLRAWRLLTAPPLPQLEAIATATPQVGDETRLLAFGRIETQGFTCWNAAWVQMVGCGGGTVHTGYPWTAFAKAKRWGTNRVSQTGAALDSVKNTVGISEEVFATDFNSVPRTVLETQSTVGDSGGALFVPDGLGGWELAGLALFIFNAPQPNRPSELAILDEDITLYADLSYYRQQILDETGVLLPEAAGGFWAGLACLGLLARRRRPA